jgi:hypothetical protein
MKKYRFNKLNKKAKMKAIEDYQKSFLDEDADNTPQSIKDIEKALSFDCLYDFWYTKDGDWIDDSTQ